MARPVPPHASGPSVASTNSAIPPHAYEAKKHRCGVCFGTGLNTAVGGGCQFCEGAGWLSGVKEPRP